VRQLAKEVDVRLHYVRAARGRQQQLGRNAAVPDAEARTRADDRTSRLTRIFFPCVSEEKKKSKECSLYPNRTVKNSSDIFKYQKALFFP
jgi:hypothetical protein